MWDSGAVAERGVREGEARICPSPYLGEGPTPRQESPPLSAAASRLLHAVLGPAPYSLSLLPFTSSLPLSLLPTPTSPDSLPASLSFFARDRAHCRGRAGAAPPLPCPRTQIPGRARAPSSHAVRRMEVPPPPARRDPGAGPGRSAPRAPDPALTPGRRHQEAGAAGAEEDGSVTGGGGSGGLGLSLQRSLGGLGCSG